MDASAIEVIAECTKDEASPAVFVPLNDLQLAFVGGGIADVVAA